MSLPPSISPACRENGILTASPPCFSLLLAHHTPAKAPLLLLGVLGTSPVFMVLSCGSPREVFATPAGKVITLPCLGQLELGGGQKGRDECPILKDDPSHWQPPCHCSVFLVITESPSPFCLGCCISSLPPSHLGPQEDSPAACDRMPLAPVCMEEELVRGGKVV